MTVFADIAAWSRVDLERASENALIDGVILGNPFCAKLHSRDGTQLEMMVELALRLQLRVGLYAPLYLVGESLARWANLAHGLLSNHEIDVVLVADLGAAAELADCGSDVCWSLFGWGRAMRPLNTRSLGPLSEIGVTCVETPDPAHVAPVREIGLKCMLHAGCEPPVSISRFCYQERLFPGSCTEDPACCSEDRCVTMELDGTSVYRVRGHEVLQIPGIHLQRLDGLDELSSSSDKPTLCSSPDYVHVQAGSLRGVEDEIRRLS